MFKEFIVDETTMLINVNMVVKASPSDDGKNDGGTVLELTNGSVVYLKESYEFIKNKLMFN